MSYGISPSLSESRHSVWQSLAYGTWNSVQCYVAAWMGGEFGGEWIHTYVWPSSFAVHVKLLQHSQLAIPEYKIKSFYFFFKGQILTLRIKLHSAGKLKLGICPPIAQLGMWVWMAYKKKNPSGENAILRLPSMRKYTLVANSFNRKCVQGPGKQRERCWTPGNLISKGE